MRFGLVEELVVYGVTMDGFRGRFGGEVDSVTSFRAISNGANINNMEAFLAIRWGMFSGARCTLAVVVVVGSLCCFFHLILIRLT